jgi:hypothetical protein
MTPDENDELRAFGEDISRAENSKWEPRCVARAFLPTEKGDLVFTMGIWLELDNVRSPLLSGEHFTSLEELERSARNFGLSTGKLSPEEAASITASMREAVSNGFGMALKMKPAKEGGSASSKDGFGVWLPMYTFLLIDVRLSQAEAHAFPVGQAFALLAACKRNAGWQEADTSYALRDLTEEKNTHE